MKSGLTYVVYLIMKTKKELVMVESPYAGNGVRSVKEHIEYARKCIVDSLKRGEAPFAMHLLYPQVLDDHNGEERALGIGCGLAWSCAAQKVIFYCDCGISRGMCIAYKRALELGQVVEVRFLTVGCGEEDERLAYRNLDAGVKVCGL